MKTLLPFQEYMGFLESLKQVVKEKSIFCLESSEKCYESLTQFHTLSFMIHSLRQDKLVSWYDNLLNFQRWTGKQNILLNISIINMALKCTIFLSNVKRHFFRIFQNTPLHQKVNLQNFFWMKRYLWDSCSKSICALKCTMKEFIRIFNKWKKTEKPLFSLFVSPTC